jgi:hypothetical protein
MDPNEALAKRRRVVAETIQGEPHARGRVVAYCDQPTYVIEQFDGTRFSWAARLVKPDELTEIRDKAVGVVHAAMLSTAAAGEPSPLSLVDAERAVDALIAQGWRPVE